MFEKQKSERLLTDPALWRNVAGYAVRSVVSKAGATYERQRDKNSLERQKSGRELLEVLDEFIPDDSPVALIENHPLNRAIRPGSCPVLSARDGYEHDFLTVSRNHHGAHRQTRLNLYQAHVKSHHNVFIATQFLIQPDGQTDHTRTPLRLRPRDPGLSTDFDRTMTPIATIEHLTDLVETGDLSTDPLYVSYAIDHYFGRVALMNRVFDTEPESTRLRQVA